MTEQHKWTHSICDLCWKEKYPDREPVKLTDDDLQDCCFCGRFTRSGIYVRHEPFGLVCSKGVEGA